MRRNAESGPTAVLFFYIKRSLIVLQEQGGSSAGIGLLLSFPCAGKGGRPSARTAIPDTLPSCLKKSVSFFSFFVGAPARKTIQKEFLVGFGRRPMSDFRSRGGKGGKCMGGEFKFRLQGKFFCLQCNFAPSLKYGSAPRAAGAAAVAAVPAAPSAAPPPPSIVPAASASSSARSWCMRTRLLHAFSPMGGQQRRKIVHVQVGASPNRSSPGFFRHFIPKSRREYAGKKKVLAIWGNMPGPGNMKNPGET
jgi:hypothetical protein